MHKKVSIYELEEQDLAVNPVNDTILENPKKFNYTMDILKFGLLAFITVNTFFGLRNFYITNQAIEIVKTTDFGYNTLDEMRENRIAELSRSNAFDLDSEAVLSSSYGYRQDLQITKMRKEIDGDYSKPDWQKPIFEVSEPKWEAHIRSGNGDTTPGTYVWVKATQNIDVYRTKRFSGEKVKADSFKIAYGPFLIDLDRNLYSGSTSGGDGYVDFWNMEQVDSDWKPIPGR